MLHVPRVRAGIVQTLTTVAGPKLGSLLSFAGATGAHLDSRRAGQAARWSIETGAAVNTYQRPQLRKQMNRFAPIASDDFIIMIPDGMLETKQEDIDGAKNFNGRP